jgi:hypothetical protein
MKKLITFILLALSITTFGQLKSNSTKDSTIAKSTFVVGTDTPGKCLIKSSGSSIAGLVLMGFGAGIMAYSTNPDVADSATQLQAVGGAVIVVGAIFQIRGIVLIGKAGKLMEKERQKTLSYYVSPTQTGLRFNF